MRETEFENFLNFDSNITSKTKAIRSRVSKARMIEKQFKNSLDYIVADDNLMYKILIDISKEMKDTNGSISNSLRKYYKFVNGKDFPSLARYKYLDKNGV